MGEKLLNGFISALFGAMAGVGAVWYLSDNAPTTGSVQDTAVTADSARLPSSASFDSLEVKHLKVTDGIRVHDSATGEPLIELKDGAILAKKRVLSEYLGGHQLVGQRLQITTGDVSVPDHAVYGEMATNEEGGAYFALLSPKGTHSVNIGFDKQETGFIISQNNKDSAMVAQAILPIPTSGGEIDGTLPTEPAPNVAVPARLPDTAAGAPGDFPLSGDAALPPISEPTPAASLIPVPRNAVSPGTPLPEASIPGSSLPETPPTVLSPSDLSISENPTAPPF